MQRKSANAPQLIHEPAPSFSPIRPRPQPSQRIMHGVGNQSLGRFIQAKLRISQPGDRCEQEADRAADHVMRMPDPAVAVGPTGHRATDIAGGVEPMPDSARRFLEPRFGRNFGHVRLHTDSRAAESARAIDARAYTLGSDVVFGAGEYMPGTSRGEHLLAHELAHVAQNSGQGSEAPSTIRRQPDPNPPPSATAAPATQSTSTPATEPPSPTTTATTSGTTPAKTEPIPSTKAPLFWRVVTADTYPLLADILGDLFWQRPKGQEGELLKPKGYESAGLFTMGTAALLPIWGTGGGKYDPAAGLGKNYKVWKSYVDAIEPLTPSTGSIIDGLSTILRLRLDDYLASDRFTLRLKQHPVGVAALLLAAEGIYYAATSTEGASGELSNTPKWSGLTGFPVLLAGALLKEQLKAPDFFNLAPLIMKSHPAYNTTPFAGEAPPSDLTLEGSEGAGPNQGGQAYKFATTLNIAKLAAPKDLQPKDLDDLRKYRGPQGSIWFSLDSFDPTATMAAAGRLAESKLKSGFLLGAGGFLATLETGATFDGPNAVGLTSWFLKGGFGYSGPKQSVLNKIGFTATLLDFKPEYNLAPLDPAGAPVGGWAARFTPFLGLDFGSPKSKLSFATAMSLVTGSTESFSMSDIRGDISYTYMGESSEEKLPVFKATVSGSASRFDWWNKDSPWMYGIKSTLQFGPVYGGAQVMAGAGKIPDQRASLIDKPENVKKNFSFLVTAGWLF